LQFQKKETGNYLMIRELILLAAAIVPALVLLRYYYRQDKAKPEPLGMIVRVFVWGCVSIIPALVLEVIADRINTAYNSQYLVLTIFVKSFLIAGLIEEFLKQRVVLSYAYKHPAFDEVMDGIVYSVVAGLGFAVVENIFYVLEGGINVAIARSFTSLPLHAIAAGLMGFYIGKAKFAENIEQERRYLRTGLIMAVLYHGIYDFIIFSMPYVSYWFFALALIFLILGFLNLRKKIQIAVQEDLIAGRQNSQIRNSISMEDSALTE
jgi:RsiW-degrading membrane proteinase PrsW (M82 family)